MIFSTLNTTHYKWYVNDLSGYNHTNSECTKHILNMFELKLYDSKIIKKRHFFKLRTPFFTQISDIFLNCFSNI